MRLGLVVPGFSADAADWCIPALRHLTRALAIEDEVRVFTLRYPYQRGRYAIDGADVIALGGADRRGLSTASVGRTTLMAIRAEHRRRPFDVLHAFWATESGLLAALAGRVLRIPTLVSLAGGELVKLRDINYGDQRSRWERLKVAASLRLAARVTAGSRTLLEHARGFVDERKLYWAPLGVPTELFHGQDNSGCGLIHVGTLTPVKDHVTLLRALAKVRDSDASVRLDVVGGGPLRESLEQLAAALGVQEGVRFRGDVDHGRLPDLYRAAQAVVVSSRHEAQCMAALEGAACGLAVAGTRVGVVPELAPAPSVARVGEPESLAEAICATLAAPNPPDVTDFTLDVCTDRFRRLYQVTRR